MSLCLCCSDPRRSAQNYLPHLPPHLRRSSIGPLTEQLRPLPLPLLLPWLSRPASLPAPLGQRARPPRRLPRRWRRRSSTASSPAGCPAVAPHHRFILIVAGCGCPSAGTSERVMDPRAISTSAAVRQLAGGYEGGVLRLRNWSTPRREGCRQGQGRAGQLGRKWCPCHANARGGCNGTAAGNRSTHLSSCR